MTVPFTAYKDPDAVLDYTIDWGTSWLPSGDTLLSSTWSTTDTITIEDQSNTTTTTTVWVSGGVVNAICRLINHIVTADGREDDRTLTFHINQR